MTDGPRHQLGEFLRSRRQRLQPRHVGLPDGSRRRTSGLRREEVAELANISTDWYTRIEQGRPVTPSPGNAHALGSCAPPQRGRTRPSACALAADAPTQLPRIAAPAPTCRSTSGALFIR
ncbi:MAG: helix-turn-helix transcriptional regulator [Ilumatobacteraceae bacterium]